MPRANRIRELREEFHMTQVRLSVELEVSQETISAYEKQKHYPSFPQLVKLSSLFNASIDYIMGLSPVRNPVSMSDNDNYLQLISIGKKLSGIQLELALAYIRGLIDMAGK